MTTHSYRHHNLSTPSFKQLHGTRPWSNTVCRLHTSHHLVPTLNPGHTKHFQNLNYFNYFWSVRRVPCVLCVLFPTLNGLNGQLSCDTLILEYFSFPPDHSLSLYAIKTHEIPSSTSRIGYHPLATLSLSCKKHA